MKTSLCQMWIKHELEAKRKEYAAISRRVDRQKLSSNPSAEWIQTSEEYLKVLERVIRVLLEEQNS